MANERPVFSDRQAAFVLHLATRLVPEAASLDPRRRRRIRLIMRRMLRRRSGGERFQVRLFLWVIRWLPAPVFFRPFERVPTGVQNWLLRRLESAPLKLVRAGFWGFKTLIFLGYYGQKQTAAAIHYTPSLHNGNDFLT